MVFVVVVSKVIISLQMHTLLKIVAILRGARSFEDECGLAFDDHSILCDDRGFCRKPNIPTSYASCKEAVRTLNDRFGSTLREELPDGLLRIPKIVPWPVWPSPGYIRSIDSFPTDYHPTENLTAFVNHLIRSVTCITDEIEFWAPRIVFIPRRTQKCQVDAVRDIAMFGRTFESTNGAEKYVIRALKTSPVIHEFYTQVTDLFEVISKMGHTQDSIASLRSLIPFLFIASILTSRFPLPNVYGVGFQPFDLHLMQTLGQYNPWHKSNQPNQGSIWAFHVMNTARSGWEDYTRERFLLPMGPNMERRGNSQMLASIGCTYPMDLAQCSSAIRQNAALYVSGEKQFDAIHEYVANLLLIVEKHLSDTVLVDSVHHALDAGMLIDRNTNKMLEFSPYVSNRANTVLYKHFRDHVSLLIRIRSAFLVPAGRSIATHASGAAPVGDTPHAMVDFVMSKRVFQLYSAFDKFIDKRWLAKFFSNVILGSLVLVRGKQATLAPTLGYRGRRAIGRVLAILIWRGDSSITSITRIVEVNLRNAVPGSPALYLDILFGGSEAVRRGFYDWFSFEALENYVDVHELPAALQLYGANPHYLGE